MPIGKRVTTSVICLVWLCASSAAFAQLQDVTIHTIDGRTQSGTIRGISRDGKVAGLQSELNLSDISLIEVKRAKPQQSPPKQQVVVHLFGGSKVLGNRVVLEKEKVRIRSSDGDYSLSVQSLRGIIWSSSQDSVVKPLIEQSDSSQDRVIVGIGENVVTREGLLESLTTNDLGFKYQGKSRSISMDKVRGLVMADLGIKEIDGLKATITTTNQNRWKGVIRSLKQSSLSLSIDSESSVSLPVDQIQRIEIASDRLVYLSDLQPTKVEESSQFVVSRKFKKDLSIGGNPMEILDESGNKIRLSKGLGVQASSELTFENAGFDRIRGIVGIDLETHARGNCIAIINGDGIRLWEKNLVGGRPAIPLDIDVTGIEKITLVVSPGQEFDLADHVDWGELRLIKTR